MSRATQDLIAARFDRIQHFTRGKLEDDEVSLNKRQSSRATFPLQPNSSDQPDMKNLIPKFIEYEMSKKRRHLTDRREEDKAARLNSSQTRDTVQRRSSSKMADEVDEDLSKDREAIKRSDFEKTIPPPKPAPVKQSDRFFDGARDPVLVEMIRKADLIRKIASLDKLSRTLDKSLVYKEEYDPLVMQSKHRPQTKHYMQPLSKSIQQISPERKNAEKNAKSLFFEPKKVKSSANLNAKSISRSTNTRLPHLERSIQTSQGGRQHTKLDKSAPIGQVKSRMRASGIQISVKRPGETTGEDLERLVQQFQFAKPVDLLLTEEVGPLFPIDLRSSSAAPARGPVLILSLIHI
eukprot:TRINITY_DN8323_c0_g1_i1.p1 TRINITY_DN8323_c0_g1~~TRINITY_DN8323_c0_g1_i1.p1  ORF type:complete len:350 (+),score=63.37 TRINITY_DN8323_c0_g1_i1:147-1196(+)